MSDLERDQVYDAVALTRLANGVVRGVAKAVSQFELLPADRQALRDASAFLKKASLGQEERHEFRLDSASIDNAVAFQVAAGALSEQAGAFGTHKDFHVIGPQKTKAEFDKLAAACLTVADKGMAGPGEMQELRRFFGRLSADGLQMAESLTSCMDDESIWLHLGFRLAS